MVPYKHFNCTWWLPLHMVMWNIGDILPFSTFHYPLFTWILNSFNKIFLPLFLSLNLFVLAFIHYWLQPVKTWKCLMILNFRFRPFFKVFMFLSPALKCLRRLCKVSASDDPSSPLSGRGFEQEIKNTRLYKLVRLIQEVCRSPIFPIFLAVHHFYRR